VGAGEPHYMTAHPPDPSSRRMISSETSRSTGALNSGAVIASAERATGIASAWMLVSAGMGWGAAAGTAAGRAEAKPQQRKATAI
jgi:hypothetical protein